MRAALVLAFLSIGLLILPPGAGAEEKDWTFRATPYVWLPTVNTTLRYSASGPSSTPDVHLNDDLLDDIDGFFMMNGEARHGRWFAMTDYIYMNFSGVASNIPVFNNVHTTSSLSGDVWTLVGGYRVYENTWVDLDALTGVRYFGMRASSDLSLTASRSLVVWTKLWDGLAGLKGRIHLGGSSWFLPYYGDVGGGSSALTGQMMAGVGVTPLHWLEFELVYRYLYYDGNNSVLIQNGSFRGPAFGINFRF